MPYKSQNQRAYMNIHKDELEKKGVNVDEWNESSKGKVLPKKVPSQGMQGGIKAAMIRKKKKIQVQNPTTQ